MPRPFTKPASREPLLGARRAGRMALLPFALALVNWAAPAQAQDAAALQARHESLKSELAASAFDRPLVLQSAGASDRLQGDAYAVLSQPFATVIATFKRPDAWCDVMLLQHNTKRCVPQDDKLQVAVGRKFEQSADNAFQLEFVYKVRAAQSDYLQVQMSAAQGPVGTSDYRLVMEAVPLGDGKTFIHMAYSYASGFAARMATDAYLATSGRDKVGFSVTGRDPAGKPQLVGGVRGIAERNTMRYYLAIETVLDTLKLPASEQPEARLKRWFAATERHSRQLREMSLEEYLTVKRGDRRE